MLVIETDTYFSSKEKLVNQFFKSTVNKYILGRNENSKNLSFLCDFDGFIDDFTTELAWLDKPIFKSNDIKNKDCIVVSCSLAIYPHSALKSLEKSGFKNVLNYLEVVKYSKKYFDSMFLTDAKNDIEENFSKYEGIYDLIKDKKSKKIFKDIVSFRKNLDLTYMKDYKVDQIGQYFENFLKLTTDEVFVDVGGFDGQTSIEFTKRCPNYKSIYLIEPSNGNLEIAKNNLKNNSNINFISKGLSNQKGTLKFNSDLGSSSNISENGTVTVEVDTLDNLVKEKVSFIKMDIEGAERLAIDGMKNHIVNGHPKLAISVYHKVDDLWEVPEQVFSIRDDYDIFLRHYTEGTDETVMFFIPKN